MSLRLAAASAWLPPWVLVRELARVDAATTSALDRLLAERGRAGALRVERRRGGVCARRRAMTEGHTQRVARLIDLLGREAALHAARDALYAEGVRLGEEARRRLRVKRTRSDLLRAARVLYRVLGISFHATWTSPSAARVEVRRCGLACGYSPEACLALSATDAGVVAGLWPGARLEFDERMTEGRTTCVARLALPDAGGDSET